MRTYENSRKKIRKDSLVVLRMKHIRDEQEELLGTIQIGTMIPVPDSEISLYDLDNEKDKKYKDLVKNELTYIRKNKNKIIKNVKTLYAMKKAGSEEKIVANCFDFIGAEKLCDEWEK